MSSSGARLWPAGGVRRPPLPLARRTRPPALSHAPMPSSCQHTPAASTATHRRRQSVAEVRTQRLGFLAHAISPGDLGWPPGPGPLTNALLQKDPDLAAGGLHCGGIRPRFPLAALFFGANLLAPRLPGPPALRSFLNTHSRAALSTLSRPTHTPLGSPQLVGWAQHRLF